MVTASDYYPFGMNMPGRNYNAPGAKDFRYGFNGKENDNEVKGEGNQQDYGMRIYDPRLGRFLSRDPLTYSYPYYTPYSFAGNKPIWCIDLDGTEDSTATNKVTFSENFKNITKISNPPIIAGVINGTYTSLNKTWNFITSDAWKASTWKTAGKFIEQGILSTSTVPVAPTPLVDAKVDEFMTQVVNGDAYSRSAYFSELGTNIFTAYVGSKGLGAIKNTVMGAARTRLAASFYAKANYAVDNAVQHMEGIDFTKAVQTTTLSKGTIVQQWVGKNGVGNYFTTLENGASKNLGIGYEGRTLKQFTLTEDVSVLKSTAGTLNGNVGGGTQFFSAELKSKIIPTPTKTP